MQGIAITTQTTAQTAIQFVLQHPAITSAVVGMSRMEQLIKIDATADKTNLAKADIEILLVKLPATFYEQHR